MIKILDENVHYSTLLISIDRLVHKHRKFIKSIIIIYINKDNDYSKKNCRALITKNPAIVRFAMRQYFWNNSLNFSPATAHTNVARLPISDNRMINDSVMTGFL